MNNNKAPKKVCVFGKGQLAIDICKIIIQNPIKYKLDLVVPVWPEPKWTTSLFEWARKENIETKILKKEERFSGHYFDLGFSCFYDKIFIKDEIKLFGDLLNLHNGPLPRYRGVNPINWALKNKESKHGVTIHRITEGIDAGPIYGQIIFPIKQENEVIDVLELSYKFGKNLAQAVLENLENISPFEQEDSNSLYYSKKDFEKLGDRSNFRRITPNENNTATELSK